MSSCLWIRNGRVIDPANQRDGAGDVFVRDGLIVESLSAAQKAAATIIDAAGKIVAPGFVDLHAHLREPGGTARETIATGSRAAAAGGFTTVVCMPDTNPPADNAGTVQLIKDIVAREAVVRVLPTGTVTLGHKGEKLAPIGTLKKAGVVAVTDTNSGLSNNEIMRRALEYAAMFDLVVFDHCQDSSMTDGAQMHEGARSLRLGLRGWPRAAEDVVAASDCILSQLTGARLHLQHLSSAGAVDTVRFAKSRGVRVTAEVSPQHLLLTDEAVETYDTNAKLNPPLREESDRLALIAGLLDGTIDAIASDHAPSSPTEKDCEFDYAPFGAIALETALPVCLAALVTGAGASLPFLISKLTVGPASVLGLDAGTLSFGKAADIVIFDPAAEWVVSESSLNSKSSNTPFLGRTLKGRVTHTVVAGRVVVSDAKVIV
jgi:dihydroorotase